jgi:membrane-bound lytic murein transglycosylase B
VGGGLSTNLGRNVALGIAGLVVAVVLLAGAAVGGVVGALGGGGDSSSSGGTVSPAATIPPTYLALYTEAAATCPGLSWSVLAAIGTIESGNGTSTAPGVQSGVNFAGVAMGPMQFEEATFAEYDEPIPPGGADPPSPYDPTDAIYAAARLLCANGARGGIDLSGAVWSYNHSSAYVADVLALAGTLAKGP